MSSNGSDSGKVRLDRWLWAARFFKTRAQAKSAIEGGKVHINQQGDSSRQNRPKVSKEIAIGDILTIRRGDLPETVLVKGLAEKRGSAKVAATLFEETPQSIEAREAERARRGMERLGLQVPSSRPSKNARRALRKLKQEGEGD